MFYDQHFLSGFFFFGNASIITCDAEGPLGSLKSRVSFFSFLSSVAAAHPFSVAFTNRWQFPTHDSTTVGAKPVSSIYPSSMHLLIGPFSASKYLVCGDERIGRL